MLKVSYMKNLKKINRFHNTINDTLTLNNGRLKCKCNIYPPELQIKNYLLNVRISVYFSVCVSQDTGCVLCTRGEVVYQKRSLTHHLQSSRMHGHHVSYSLYVYFFLVWIGKASFFFLSQGAIDTVPCIIQTFLYLYMLKTNNESTYIPQTTVL